MRPSRVVIVSDEGLEPNCVSSDKELSFLGIPDYSSLPIN